MGEIVKEKITILKKTKHAQINGIPTNVNVELGESATAQDVVRVVVQ